MQIQQVVASFLASSNLFGYDTTESQAVAVAEEPEFAFVDSDLNVYKKNASNGSNGTSSNAAAGAFAAGNTGAFAVAAGIAALLL
ncbi:CYFA0S01e18140g1_1 [Cyberlindnera fabianii]|uniref:CYFA0S01e18140g1_1 n=1 Tax=Cyberlindnera fabianii TaxID=36022 RepID=A0A061AJS6_CYBFA|nr:CYFA0S01e18140g1_1 [Cyberlindnera fabianii]